MGIGERGEVESEVPVSEESTRGDGGKGAKGTKGRRSGRAAKQRAPADVADGGDGRTGLTPRELRALLAVLRDVRAGDFSARLPEEGSEGFHELAEVVNDIVAEQNRVLSELNRVSTAVSREGRMAERVVLRNGEGGWGRIAESINTLISDLLQPTTEVARVIEAVAQGDLSQKMVLSIDGKTVQGEFLRIGTTVNRMVDQLSAFASEVTRVSREVGTEGVLGGQAKVAGVAGTWRDLTDSVNAMASNLTNQVRNIAVVTTAVANGDLSQKITVEAKGEIQELKNTINTMVEQLQSFASEVARVAREVGTDGVLGGQANVPGVAGAWKDLTENVNSMASNLTGQVRNIAVVTTAVARGDLSQKITVEAKGEILELKNTMNVMVDQLSSFAAEVTRVAREVGSEGQLGGQAQVEGIAGVWRDLTENVNAMAGNLTVQLRDVSAVATAIASGDLTRKITVEARGEILQIKDVINRMVDQLGGFAAEVTRVAREVGTEGRLGGQANVPGVGGTWKDLTDSVNAMASNLTGQVRSVADVTTAVARGDLSKKITVEAKGEILELTNTINTMVDQLSAFADEVTRVAREVGTEGQLGGQANVPGVGGTWKDLTDNVNYMASNLTYQVRNIAVVTTAVAAGDLSQKITVEARGEMLELKNTINNMVDRLRVFADEVARVAHEVGTEGQLGGQAKVPGVAGAWKDLTENVNSMANNLTVQVRNIAEVTTAVASGDLSKKITVEVRGELLQLKSTVNTMVDQLSSFAAEVTRVAREVGSEGKLGGQARVPGAAGTWRDLTDNVNAMANNLTSQVRNIAEVTTAVAAGDLSQKITVEARGEILELKKTINDMVDRLRVFADEVTRVAREVGAEGKLGGQAEVPNVAGTWKDLTDNVNAMANNLTVQVRAIADVATAVTEGDLTRQVNVEAQGEVAELKNNVNQMIANLRETTKQNQEQDWLKSNLAKFSRMMQGQKDLETVSRLIMSELTPLVSAHYGAFFIRDAEGEGGRAYQLIASYAYKSRKHLANRFLPGEGLVGQAVLEKQPILLTNVPDDYVQITSGLGAAPPRNIIVLPILFEDTVKAVIELGSFLPFSANHQIFLDQLAESIGVVLNMIQANMRTEELLIQSQKLTQELQSQSRELQLQQEELKRSNTELEAQAKSLKASEELLKEQQEELQQVNEELEEKASLLAEQNKKVELKNNEVEKARVELEEKARQLALSSKYKSEFLANMSHELRTPLNSLLILARLLSDNKEGNLSPKQVDFARTILSSGTDLLNLINDVLDLSKVEAGKMEITPTDVPLADLAGFVDRTFRPMAEQKKLDFGVEIAPDVPRTIFTDGQRVEQVLKNLLSNAFKFTESGSVRMTISLADRLRAADSLKQAEQVIAFAVRDTGIGISKDKQQLIFEAFQQADGTTSRKYGGTGLGLSISRELARLLGGEIRVHSVPGEGSTFTLLLPVRYVQVTQIEDMMSRLPGGPGAARARPARGRASGARGAGSSPVPRNGGGSDAPAQDASARNAPARNAPARNAPARSAPASDAAQNESGDRRAGDGSVDTPASGRGPEREDGDGATMMEAGEHPQAFFASTAGTALEAGPEDDRATITPDDRVVLVIENDPTFAGVLLEMAHEKGFKGIIALDGGSAVTLAHEFRPDAITLDIDLGAGEDGWQVLERLKRSAETRHIPVHIISGVHDRRHGLMAGALAYLEKPVSKEALEEAFGRIAGFIDRSVRNLLIVEDDETQRMAIEELIGHEDVEITSVGTADDALRAIGEQHFDCMVLDLGLQGTSGFDLLERVKADPEHHDLPIIIYTGKSLSEEEETRLRRYAETIILKDVKSPERLLDETALFLHRVEAKLPEQKRRMLEQLHSADDAFSGKHVLVVDDDVRNIFSLTSVLEDHGMKVSFAENGRDALDKLPGLGDVDIVLMDIMMPEMDGYETTKAIREMPKFRQLPIIALTAKAMKGDREKTIAAGASDYITKPVDTEQLLSLMRVWLYR